MEETCRKSVWSTKGIDRDGEMMALSTVLSSFENSGDGTNALGC